MLHLSPPFRTHQLGRSVLEASPVLDKLYLKLAKNKSNYSQSGQRSGDPGRLLGPAASARVISQRKVQQ